MSNDQGMNLQKEVDRILDYLQKLSTHYDLYSHRPAELRDVGVQTYYTMIARKVQNDSVGKLKRGFETGDPETFLQGMAKFEEAAKILDLGIENPEETNAFYQEMINLFLKFISESSESVGRFEPKGVFFKLQSLIAIANVLENTMNDFAKAAGYRSQAAVYEKRWKKALQYIYIIFDLVLSGNFEVAQKFLEKFDSKEIKEEILKLSVEGSDEENKTLLDSLDAFKSLGAVIIGAVEKRTRESVNIIIEKINELSNKGIPITLVSLQKFTQKLAQALGFEDVVSFKSFEQVELEKLKPPMPPNAQAQASPAMQPPVSQDLVSKMKDTMSEEMQKVMEHAKAAQKAAIENAQGDPNAPSVDLNMSSLEVIKQAIAEGMKGLANEIVSQLSSKIGSFGGGGGGGYVGRGPMRDLDGPGGGPPQIKSLGRAKPTERPPRPKLSDMLDSVIVED
ncbi:MAG: hypothetical protein ACTSVI_04275 [Promethearchaeota archaeon]